jgi:putative hydrolase of the HAD superfamily
MPYPRAIFFDAMGTLFSLREPVGQTYARVAASHGIHADADKLSAAFRSAWQSLPPPVRPERSESPDDDRSWWKHLVRRTFEHALGSSPAPDAFAKAFDDLYHHYAKAEAWELHDDTLPALAEMARGSRLLVLSNFDRRLRSILRGLNINDVFDHIIVSSEVGAAKPHPRMFQAALRLADAPAEECLHVGDDLHADCEGARAADIACFLLERPRITLRTLKEKLAQDDFPACIGRFSD